LIRLGKPVYDVDGCLQNIHSCLKSGWTGRGPKCEEFEYEWKQYTKHPNAHFVSSGTAALHLALELAKSRRDLRRSEEPTVVITTPMTFVSTNHAIKYAGLKPWFADIDGSLNLDPNHVEHYLQDDIYNDVLAVMFVCMGGNTKNLNEVYDLCKDYGKLLIVDAAHAAGSTGLKGDYICYSFQATKNLPTADSGMLCCDNYSDDQLARRLSWMGIDRLLAEDRLYDVPYLGWKYTGNDIMASIALAQIHLLNEHNEIRTSQAWYYSKHLPVIPHKCHFSSHHLCQMLVPAQKRGLLLRYAREHGVELGVHYETNLKYPMYEGWCPIAATYSSELVSLPIGPHLLKTGQDKVIDVVKDVI
jgi:dTDP-4-amino-4,6-dideoxygalactose transaminase